MEPKEVLELNQEIVTCSRCRLYDARIKAVPGEGPVPSHLFFIGEAPGRNEDLSGRPFVGRAGAVLNELLSSIGLSRNRVFITSIVKCRPPGNRIPKKDEIEACSGYLDRQIELLSPGIIIPMGQLASGQVFLHFGMPQESIGRIHGRVFQSETTRGHRVIIPVYHPAAMTHNPPIKNAVFNDFNVIGRLLHKRE